MLSIPSLVTATKSALKSFKDESNENSSNSVEGMEEAYVGKKFRRTRSELSIPSLVKSTKIVLKS